jgi:3-hydroxybutyryl-CoA dehydrogenase
MDIKKPFVVGAGIMGAGVGQLCAQQGLGVTVVDISEEIVEKAKGKVAAGLNRRVEKGKITQTGLQIWI